MGRNGVSRRGGYVEWEHGGWARFALHWGMGAGIGPFAAPEGPRNAGLGLRARTWVLNGVAGMVASGTSTITRPFQRNSPQSVRCGSRVLVN